MPIDIKGALADRRLTSTEADDLINQAQPTDVETIVEELGSAVVAPIGTELDTSDLATINGFLGRLDQVAPLPLDRQKAQQPDGTMNWLSALKSSQTGDVLPQKTFTGSTVAVDGKGRLLVDEHRVSMGTGDAALSAMYALAKSGQLDALPVASRTRLIDSMLAAVEGLLPVAIDAPGKFRAQNTMGAVFAAIAGSPRNLTSAQLDRMIVIYDRANAPVVQGLIARAVDGATTVSAAQKQKRDAWSLPAAVPALLEEFDRLRTASGLKTELALTALMFSKDDTAIAAFNSAMNSYQQIDGAWDFSDAEARAALIDLETYVDASTTNFVFVFGSLGQQAAANAAKVSNALLKARVTPELTSATPKLGDVPLTTEQAQVVLSILPGIKNEAAFARLVEALKETNVLFGAVTPASFELFKTAALRAFERKGDAKDQMIDMYKLATELETAAEAINAELAPRLATLSQTPPSYDDVALAPAVASKVRSILETQLRSELSVSNIGGALKVLGQANANRIDDTTQLDTLMQTYVQNWPSAKVFDFNKLARMATFIVQGRSVPLCTINGQAVSLGEFYTKVGATIAAAIDKTKVEYEWMPDRFGQRAMQAAELLDVIAQQTAEGKGPLSVLAQRFPGKVITVQAAASSSAHDAFVFDVQGVGKFTQGSDGGVSPYNKAVSNVMFSATVKADGTFDVKAPASIKPNAWPLQTAYAVGDSIDISQVDPDSATSTVEGKPFSTKHKILQAKIESYDAAGRYTISYKDKNGETVTAGMTLAAIEKLNNPHNFKLTSSVFGDVSINVNAQPGLKAFIDGARPIIARFLPSDGSLLAMSPAQIAKAQRDCVAALQSYMHPLMTYPAEGTGIDAASQTYHDLTEGIWGVSTLPLEKLLEIKRGVCRHQCIIQQILLQVAGIDSRLAQGAANTSNGDFRGLHIWNELSLADNARYLSDETWSDAIVELWAGAYGNDKRRIEMYNQTAYYDANLV